MRRFSLLSILSLLLSHSVAAALPQRAEASSAGSLSLSPAVITIKTKPGGSSAYPLTITNLTQTKCRFVLEAFDVIVRNGKRVFVPAGEISGGIARSAIFSPSTLEVGPGQSAQAKITLTVPPEPMVRAVAAVFHGQNTIATGISTVVTGSLGTLITYSLSDRIALRADPLNVRSQSENSNLAISELLENYGEEPIVTKGTLAILSNSGELVGRVAIDPQRLLPGEKFNSVIEYPHSLPRGRYRALVSLVHEGGVQTSSIEFQVQ